MYTYRVCIYSITSNRLRCHRNFHSGRAVLSTQYFFLVGIVPFLLYSCSILIFYIVCHKIIISVCMHFLPLPMVSVLISYIEVILRNTVSSLYDLAGGSACRRGPCDLHCISPLISRWLPHPASVFTRAAVWLVF